ncbi:MAG: MFS transporter [Betaproteobacteria bacterium]|nr:MFS transporter [Betaproteobacteria bacterium]MBU6511940.1 MFS transporter [Betaproteobacteria bacterium]MDE1956711.1 MFS transporter [Betaproteobacteria bacterium]MDE2152170.1 MFS transporter [Betaproteobacteria bacterium]
MSDVCSSTLSRTRPGALGAGYWPLLAVSLGFVMAMLDVTVVNVALGSIERGLRAGLPTLVWVVDGYTLSFAALLLVGGALANRHGARRVYMGGLALFVAASVLCGAAPNGNTLVLARLVQGLGAALFMPSSLSLLGQAYPAEHERLRVFALWSAIVSVAVAAGPLVGGLVVATLGWRAVFWLNAPIGVLALVLARRQLPPSHSDATARPGIVPHLLAVTMLAALALALIEGGSWGWASPRILAALALSAAAALLLFHCERRAAAPILPRALLGRPGFAAVNAVGFLINFGAFGQLFLISLYFQKARHADAWHAGLDLLPLMAMFTLGNLLSPRVSARWGARRAMALGLGASALLSAVLAAVGEGLALPWFSAWLAAANLGVAMAVPAMTATVMQLAGKAHANIAAAALNANRQIGALIGVAAVGIVLHAEASWPPALAVALGLIAAAYLAGAMLAARAGQGARAGAPYTGSPPRRPGS